MSTRSPAFQLWLVIPLLFAASGRSAAAPPRHLFLDPAVMVESRGVTLRVNPPSPGELVLKPDRPWEKMWIPFYTTVLDEGGKLRLWYNARDEASRSNLAYAESTDGIHWTKPNLGIVNYQGSTENNLVGIPYFEGAVHRDPHGRDDERYVYLTSIHKGGGIFRYASPDGLRWKRDVDPLLPFECDSQNVAFWDEPKGKYALYLRSWGPKSPRNDRRKVVRVEADNLARPLGLKPAGLSHHESGDLARQPWIDTEATTVLAADAKDAPEVDIYTNAMQPYPLDPSWYVGFPSFFRHFVGSPQKLADGWTEAQFVGSRDGIHWHRYDRSVYAGPGLPGPYSGSMIYLGLGLVVRGDEIWQYGTRYRTTHGDVPGRAERDDGGIYRFVQRVDGFVSADFADEPGSCRLAAVKVEGPHLLLNLDAGVMGQLRVGLLDDDGQAIAGYAVDDCEAVRLNSTRARVKWKGGDNLASLQGRTVQVVITGTRTKLYSFYFTTE
jgi:hypothetical protein